VSTNEELRYVMRFVPLCFFSFLITGTGIWISCSHQPEYHQGHIKKQTP